MDVGLRSFEKGEGKYMMAFADINNDKYTDIITINKAKTTFTVHLFDTTRNMFIQQKTFRPTECTKISNIAVGRSTDRVRLFITCTQPGGYTAIKFFDK